jgi:HEAT repeat protein
MRKRWLAVIVLVVALVAVGVWMYPALLYVPLGHLQGEAFYAGKPTSFWLRSFKQEGYLGETAPTGDTGETLRKGGTQAVPVLAQLAENPDTDVRYQALVALALVGSEAKAATPVLEATISHEDNSARFLAASEALLRANPEAAAQTLTAVLHDKKNLGGRAWALAALYNYAPLGKETLPAVKELLLDPDEDPRLRIEAARVSWRWGEPVEPAVTVLCQLSNSAQSPCGTQAIEVLGDMGPAAKAAVPTLVKLLDAPKLADNGKSFGPPHRFVVIHDLGRIGPDAQAAVPALLAQLKHKDRQIHSETLLALVRISPRTKDAVPALKEALKDPNPTVRDQAAAALQRLEADSAPAKDKG